MNVTAVVQRSDLVLSVAPPALFIPGLLLGPLGPFDSVATLCWCALLAAAVGALAVPGNTGQGSGAGPVGTNVVRCLLALLSLGLSLAICCALCQQYGPRPLPHGPAGFAVPMGLCLLGFGLGAWLRPRAAAGARAATTNKIRLAGVLLGLTLLLSSAPILFGLGGEAKSLGASHPELAETLLLLAPDGLALEVGGFDWSHANPRVYAVSGVEWTLRNPRGVRAGAWTLGLGLLFCVGGVLRSRQLGRT